MKLFLKKGYVQTTVNEIVKSINVAQGTFYHYFKSKDDILDTIIETYIKAILNEIELIVNDRSLTALQKLEHISYAELPVNQRFNMNLHNIKDISYGMYGIRCFLDKNGNGKLDSGLFGPTEPWGMSFKNGRPFGMPSFNDICFEVKTDKSNIFIEVK